MLPLRLSIFSHFGDFDGVGIGPVELGVGDPFDVAVAERRFENALGVADAAEAEMTDVRLGGDKGDWHAIAYFPLAKIGVDNEGEFIGRPKARRALDGADDDRARILAEALPLLGGVLGVIDMADRNGVGLRAEPFDFIEGQCRPGGDDEIVIREAAAIVEFDRVLAW